MIAIKGTIGSSGKYFVTGMHVGRNLNALLKIVFENNTAGKDLVLCAGSNADFTAGQVGLQLSNSGGPGFQFLTIITTFLEALFHLGVDVDESAAAGDMKPEFRSRTSSNLRTDA